MTRLHDATHNVQRVTHFLGRILPSAIIRAQRPVRAVGSAERIYSLWCSNVKCVRNQIKHVFNVQIINTPNAKHMRNLIDMCVLTLKVFISLHKRVTRSPVLQL